MNDFLKMFAAPPIVSAVILVGIAFNISLPDLGETYVSRNLFAWVAVILLTVHLWWQPLKCGVINWSPLWLIGLFAPAIGAFLILAINILGGFAHLHMGYYFMPFMLAGFALLILGLLQYEWDDRLKFTFVFTFLVCFMVQYGIHLVTGNQLIFSLMPFDEITIYTWLYKPFAGFGQYNLYGSVYATLLVMACWVFVCAPVSRPVRLAFLLPVALLAIDLPFTKSTTALVGLMSGMVFLTVHVLVTARDRLHISRFMAVLGVIAAVAGTVIIALAMLEQTDRINELSVKRSTFSVQTRLAMWSVGFWGFVERPLFGHGLGSFLNVYMEQFARNGLAQGLLFFPNVTVPHNLIIHILSETGLFGFAVLLGPVIYLGVRLLQLAPNRWLLLAFLAPILVHSQLEYPYIASGTHYWLFAIALVFALGGQVMPDRQWRLPSEKIGLMGFGGAVAAGGLGLYICISMALSVQQGARNYNETQDLSLQDFMQTRFQMADIAHPIIGRRMKALAYLTLINKAFEERRSDILTEFALPVFEAEILYRYPTPQIWLMALRLYIIDGDRDKAMQLVNYIARYQPDLAADYKKQVARYLALQPNRPQ